MGWYEWLFGSEEDAQRERDEQESRELEEEHNRGQTDCAEGNKYEPTHNQLDTLAEHVFTDNHHKENMVNAYNRGWNNASK